MPNQPLILVTNDDGIASPGLHAAVKALIALGDLLIVAPSSQRTSAGRGYPPVLDKIVYPTEIPLPTGSHVAYNADVSPAQAVLLAVVELAERPIDLCVSGINYGENIGTGVTISGTVGAAIEAACLDVPALAISLQTPQEFHLHHSLEVDFKVAAHFTHHFARQILTKGLPAGVDILKVDVPATATPQTPWQAARVSRQRYYQPIPSGRNRLDEEKEIGYRVNINYETLEAESDIYIFAVKKLVSVVPMSIDLTAPVALPEITKFFNETG